ncbi:M23 family metallopeptidase [Chryseobacterium koreense]|uniref:M23 family metallopeptidase n=1 Tax=Chryseobacterium koreense TaxID=232216 RepID=UPI0026F336ED|nr:M23 family metallopeptidase [Chryseobacterium koreense]
MNKLFSIFFCFAAISLFSQKKWNVNFYNEKTGNEISIFADNNEEMPMSSKFTFQLDNLNSTAANEFTVVIPEKAKRFLITKLSPKNPAKSNQFTYTNMTNFGDVTLKDFDQDYIYSLPFETGKTQLVYQGYNGKFSHQKINALDFNLKTGEKIFAAREGKVIEVVDHNTSSCANISCAKFNNNIVIMHSDGSFADYAHLKYKGATVKIGDVVEKGQLIGFSGNTGFSNGPHLHFSVYLNRIDGKRDYISTKFKTSTSEGELLQEGKTYTKNY